MVGWLVHGWLIGWLAGWLEWSTADAEIRTPEHELQKIPSCRTRLGQMERSF